MKKKWQSLLPSNIKEHEVEPMNILEVPVNSFTKKKIKPTTTKLPKPKRKGLRLLRSSAFDLYDC